MNKVKKQQKTHTYTVKYHKNNNYYKTKNKKNITLIM